MLLYQAARLIRERVRALDFIDVNDLVDEFARFIRQELDYKLEARHADTFRRNFADTDAVVVPKVYWDYSGVRMLTLEYLEGVQLADLELEVTAVDARRELQVAPRGATRTSVDAHRAPAHERDVDEPEIAPVAAVAAVVAEHQELALGTTSGPQSGPPPKPS